MTEPNNVFNCAQNVNGTRGRRNSSSTCTMAFTQKDNKRTNTSTNITQISKAMWCSEYIRINSRN